MDSETPPGSGGPIPSSVVETVAERQAVDVTVLADAVESLHGSMVDGADAIHLQYRSTGGPPAHVARDGLVAVVFVPVATWNQVTADLDEEIRTAVRAVHAEFATDVGASVVEAAGSGVPLVVPSETVGRLVRSGLSRRQAEVQVLRDAGLTQAAVGERLGIATNTVKVHCHRIDEKVADARRLLRHVEG
jgi:DNA-binding CsgD family transcriptional regulator